MSSTPIQEEASASLSPSPSSDPRPEPNANANANANAHEMGSSPTYGLIPDPKNNHSYDWSKMLKVAWILLLMGTVFWSSIKMFQSNTISINLALILGFATLALFLTPLMIVVISNKFYS